MRGKPKKGKQAKRRQRRMKRACFEDGPRFSGAKHTETGWADDVFLHHAGRKGFFDTLQAPGKASGGLFRKKKKKKKKEKSKNKNWTYRTPKRRSP